MGAKAKSVIKLTENLSLAECNDGYWLYDYTQGMNMSMKAKTEREAFVEAITKYQKWYAESKERYNKLNNSVQEFVSSVSEDDDN